MLQYDFPRPAILRNFWKYRTLVWMSIWRIWVAECEILKLSLSWLLCMFCEMRNVYQPRRVLLFPHICRLRFVSSGLLAQKYHKNLQHGWSTRQAVRCNSDCNIGGLHRVWSLRITVRHWKVYMGRYVWSAWASWREVQEQSVNHSFQSCVGGWGMFF